MGKLRILRPSLLMIPIFAIAIAAQQVEQKPAASAVSDTLCEPEATCIFKVLNLPNYTTQFDLQSVVNTLRIVLEVRYISADPNWSVERKIGFKGTTEQVAIAEKLLQELERLRTSGGSTRSSILLFEPLSRETQPEQPLRSSSRRRWKPPCKLSNCVIRMFYVPDFSDSQMQGDSNRIRSTVQIGRISPCPSLHVIVVRGTADEIAVAEKLIAEQATVKLD